MQEENNGSSRNTEIARLADEGTPHSELATRYGLSRQRISQIVNRQARQESERERELRKLYERQERRANNPPVKSTATGQTQLDPLSCTCGTRADRLRDHKPGCEVRPVYDTRVSLDADKERRMLLKEMRTEAGQQHKLASPAEQERAIAEVVTYLEQLTERNKYLERMLARYESDAQLDVVEAEIVPEVSPGALPALEAARDFYAGQL